MTRTPIEIATALKRLERYSPEIHPMVAEAAAMLREVAAERDRLTAMVEKMREYAGHRLDCDGNCEDDHLEFCLQDKRITPAERDFVNRMLGYREEQRIAAWLFSDCPDLQEK